MTNANTEEALRLELVAAIEKHLPHTKRINGNAFGFETMSAFYADRLLAARDKPLLSFGLGPAAEQWAQLRRAAQGLQNALIGLEADGLSELNWAAPVSWDKDKPLGHEAYYVSHVIKDAAYKMERRNRSRPKAGRKRNWQAAAVAKVARKIWAEEHWEADPDRPKPVLNTLLVVTLPPEEQAKAA